MAISTLAPVSGQFQHAITAYSLARGMRRSGMSDRETDAVESIIDPLFDEVIAARAHSPSEAADKAEAILNEYGEGEIPPALLLSLVADLRVMAQ